MANIKEVEPLAMELDTKERAILAEHLLHSLPSVLTDDDAGVAEATRRDTELDSDPSNAVSLDDIDSMVRQRRKD